ncbi:hypothetical protein BDP27DRAFT_1426321 [Rhodocollybia butyracea]|uniref:Uncharacterized protein n=1 Tax=Rhodocollybia butyracea TaxID=206335 RepID=A0A9P5U1U6_9AGAR|nr:hypothetical protein BDP27DRAFT_1426321 [Rhodocollybia butyracea]
MPAAHDIYSDQLRELQRGQALYYPEPSPDEGPVEIGDVGYIRQGAFLQIVQCIEACRPPGSGNLRAVLPASASFQFSCTSSRGAILMLETQMSKEYAVLEQRMKAYLVRNCLIWYDFARDIGVQVEFGDIMLVTEVSKTAAWASAVYSQSSREFGMSFSAGGAFLPISSGPPSGLAVAVAQERIGPVEYPLWEGKTMNLIV